MSARDHGKKAYSWPRDERGRRGIEITLPREKIEAIDAAAAAESIPRARWIERACDAWLARPAPEAALDHHPSPARTPT